MLCQVLHNTISMSKSLARSQACLEAKLCEAEGHRPARPSFWRCTSSMGHISKFTGSSLDIGIAVTIRNGKRPQKQRTQSPELWETAERERERSQLWLQRDALDINPVSTHLHLSGPVPPSGKQRWRRPHPRGLARGLKTKHRKQGTEERPWLSHRGCGRPCGHGDLEATAEVAAPYYCALPFLSEAPLRKLCDVAQAAFPGPPQK